jgi:hypothetical protein
MKLGTLVEAKPALERLASEKMPAKVSYKIARIIRLVNPFLEDYDMVIKKLFEKYAEDIEGVRSVPKDKFEEFKDEVMAIREEEVEPPLPYKLLLDELPESMTAFDLMALDWLIED